MERHGLTNEQWEKIRPFLPEQNRGRGRRWLDLRTSVNGILWILGTGAPWRDLPERYGKWKSVYNRYVRWSREGIWDKILNALYKETQQNGEIDWEIFFVDGSNVRAHRSAAGASKKNFS